MSSKSLLSAALIFALGGVSSALAQQTSPSDGSQLPPDQPATATSQPVVAPQPSEVEEQQIEQQQQQGDSQPPG
jgi:hypothetical protein